MNEVDIPFKCFSCVTNWKKTQGKYDATKGRKRESTFSRYPSEGWQFERDSPYQESFNLGVDAIPGFDEDGLPTDVAELASDNQSSL